MARFSTYAEVLTPDHVQWEIHARGLGCGREPGLVLREVLDRNAGRYETTMPMADNTREQARVCVEVSGDEEMTRIASPEGPIDPARILAGPFDPANPRRVLRGD